jgi:hypothetical protein
MKRSFDFFRGVLADRRVDGAERSGVSRRVRAISPQAGVDLRGTLDD